MITVAIARWWACARCTVSWNGMSNVCWCCGRDEHTSETTFPSLRGSASITSHEGVLQL